MTNSQEIPSTGFSDEASLLAVLEQIRGRVPGGPSRLADCIVEQIAQYFDTCVSGLGGSTVGASSKLVVGLSGGVDSSVVTSLAVRAVGVENVLPLTMPAWQGDPSVKQSGHIRRWLGFGGTEAEYVLDIEPLVNLEIELINSMPRLSVHVEPEPRARSLDESITAGNLASRLRVGLLLHMARRLNGRVLGTGIRTDWVLGYAAKYGTPFSYDYGVICELYKQDIYDLALLLGVPAAIIEATPTTGYFEGQTHENELGASLDELDALVYLLFDLRLPADAVIADYQISEGLVHGVLRRYRQSAHKRMPRQSHVKIRPKAFDD